MRGDAFWQMVHRLLVEVRAPADTYGNSVKNQVAITLLGTCCFWELGPILSVPIDTFWFEEVREAEIG